MFCVRAETLGGRVVGGGVAAAGIAVKEPFGNGQRDRRESGCSKRGNEVMLLLCVSFFVWVDSLYAKLWQGEFWAGAKPARLCLLALCLPQFPSFPVSAKR